jgi:hypothetical protein
LRCFSARWGDWDGLARAGLPGLDEASNVGSVLSGVAKVAATLRLAYFWPKLASTAKTILNNCPGCELEKA